MAVVNALQDIKIFKTARIWRGLFIYTITVSRMFPEKKRFCDIIVIPYWITLLSIIDSRKIK